MSENNTNLCLPLRFTYCVHKIMKISKNKDKIADNQSNISHMVRTMLKYLTLSNRNGLHYRSTNYVIRAARVPSIRHSDIQTYSQHSNIVVSR